MAFIHNSFIYLWNGTGCTFRWKIDKDVDGKWEKVENWNSKDTLANSKDSVSDGSANPVDLKFAAHQVVLPKEDGKFILFGGEHTMVGNDEFKERSCRAFELDVDARLITILKRQGEFVPGFSGHSAVLHDKSLYTFGGMTTDENDDSEVRRFDLTTFTWSIVECNTRKPSKRLNHSSLLWEHDGKFEMLVLFGCTRARDFLSDVWAFDLQKNTWRELKSKRKEKPSPRSKYAATMTDSKNGTLVLYGGETSEQKSNNELWRLDLSTMLWEHLSTSGDELESAPVDSVVQGNRASILCDENQVYIIDSGSIYMLDIQE